MGRSKNSKSNTSSDGKHRKETKEERKQRLLQQEEAREQCQKLVPVFFFIMFVFVVGFALYVRSVPPKAVSTSNPAESNLKVTTTSNAVKREKKRKDGLSPEFARALREAEVLNRKAAEEAAANEGETIEL